MDYTSLTDEQLDAERIAIITEQERRQRLSTAPGQISQIATAFIADGGNIATLTDALSGMTA